MSEHAPLSAEAVDRLCRLLLGLPESGQGRGEALPDLADRARLHLDSYAAGEDLQLARLRARERGRARDDRGRDGTEQDRGEPDRSEGRQPRRS